MAEFLATPLGTFLLIVVQGLGIIAFVMLSLLFLVYGDRKIWAAVQMRKGPNVVGAFGLLQSVADALKYVVKEIVVPAGADKFVFFLAPMLSFVLAILAWAACMAASMTANVKFGLMVADNEEWNPWVLGGATAASDVFKAITPIAGLYFLFRRWWWPAAAAALVLVVTVTYSTIAAIGFASVTRAHYNDERTGVAIRSTGTKADLEDLRNKRSFLPRSRPVGTIENDIARVKLEKTWTATGGCRDVEAWSRKFCSRVLELQSELASAKEA